jgi:hypothetical protein
MQGFISGNENFAFVFPICVLPDAICCNSEIHNIGTGQNNLFPPSISITRAQKGAYYSGIRIFNHLPAKLKELSNDQKFFEIALKRFLHANSFYPLEEYFNYQGNVNFNNRF